MKQDAAAAALNIARKARAGGGAVDPIRAFHGGPNDFDEFSTDHSGAGFSQAAFGHGLNFAEDERVANAYREMASRAKGQIRFSHRNGHTLPEDHPGMAELKDLYRTYSGAPREADINDKVSNWRRWARERDAQIKDYTDTAAAERDPESAEWLRQQAHEMADDKRRYHAAADAMEQGYRGHGHGHMYEVELHADPNKMLHWHKALEKQPENIRRMVDDLNTKGGMPMNATTTGDWIYHRAKMAHQVPDPAMAHLKDRTKTDYDALNRYFDKHDVHGIKWDASDSRVAPSWEHGSHNYTIWDPKRIKVKRKYAFGGIVDRIARSTGGPLNDQGFYSHAAVAARAIQQAKGTGQQMLASLKGVKPDELKWSGAQKKFANQKSVTKDELASHFDASLPKIGETVLGGRDGYNVSSATRGSNGGMYHHPELPDSWHPDMDLAEQERSRRERLFPNDTHDLLEKTEGGRSRYEEYTMPGGHNYRELLMHLPTADRDVDDQARHEHGDRESELIRAHDQIKDRKDAHRQAGEEIPDELVDQQIEARHALNKHREMMINESRARRLPYEQHPFEHNHWRDTQNVVAHLRMKDRDLPEGGKALHLEELQSDWGQQARKHGIADPEAATALKAANSRMSEAQQMVRETRRNLAVLAAGQSDVTQPHIQEAAQAYRAAQKEWDDAEKEAHGLADKAKGLPAAPYIDNTDKWVDLGLKRALYEAAKGGYDKMVWTPGEEQARRYGMENHLERVHVQPLDPETYGEGKVTLSARDPSGRSVMSEIMHHSEMDDHVGAELAQKLRSQLAWPGIRDAHIVYNMKSGNRGGTYPTREEAEAAIQREYPKFMHADLDVHSTKQHHGGKEVALNGLDLKTGGEGHKYFYDKLVPKRLAALIREHDPDARLGYHPVGEVGSARWRGAELSDEDVAHLRSILDDPGVGRRSEDRLQAEEALRGHEEAVKSKKAAALPGLTITPKMRESILKNGFKAYAQGGEVERTVRRSGGRVARADGGAVPTHVFAGGPVNTSVAGRTDHLPMHVESGSYVIPADIVSAMGEGNSMAGFKHIRHMFATADRSSPAASGPPVAVVIAGGEYILSPAEVRHAGEGDLDAGHKALDGFVKQYRAQTIKTLQKLPGPKKD